MDFLKFTSERPNEARAMAATDSGRRFTKALIDQAPSLQELCRENGIALLGLKAIGTAIYYRCIDVGSVNGLTKLKALKAAGVCGRELRLGDIEIRFFGRCNRDDSGSFTFGDDKQLDGFVKDTEPHVIFIRANLDECRVVSTVAHEARHLWQADSRSDLHADEQRWERDAEEYAMAMASSIDLGHYR